MRSGGSLARTVVRVKTRIEQVFALAERMCYHPRRREYRRCIRALPPTAGWVDFAGANACATILWSRPGLPSSSLSGHALAFPERTMIGAWPVSRGIKGGEAMPEPLTNRQREILEYLKFRQKIRGYPPTVREVGEAVGLSSSSTVQNHLNTLERKGYIRRDPTKSRTIEVVDIDEMQAKLSKVVAVPLIGRVAAGQPILAEENIEDHLVLSQELVGSDNAFALEVHGDSMKDVGILPGDFVVVRPGKDAPNGSIVVARLEDDQTNESTATVKRLFREANRVRLQPENAAYEPIYSTAAQLEGQVVAVVRLLR